MLDMKMRGIGGVGLYNYIKHLAEELSLNQRTE